MIAPCLVIAGVENGRENAASQFKINQNNLGKVINSLPLRRNYVAFTSLCNSILRN